MTLIEQARERFAEHPTSQQLLEDAVAVRARVLSAG
jgi:hypothetical protein